MTFASEPRHIPVIRSQVRRFLRATGFSAEEVNDIETAVGEACTNALKHGSPRGSLDSIRIKCMASERMLITEISDNGYGFDVETTPLPTPSIMTEGGMGILLMRALMDDVEFEFDQGTTVKLAKRRDA